MLDEYLEYSHYTNDLSPYIAEDLQIKEEAAGTGEVSGRTKEPFFRLRYDNLLGSGGSAEFGGIARAMSIVARGFLFGTKQPVNLSPKGIPLLDRIPCAINCLKAWAGLWARERFFFFQATEEFKQNPAEARWCWEEEYDKEKFYKNVGKGSNRSKPTYLTVSLCLGQFYVTVPNEDPDPTTHFSLKDFQKKFLQWAKEQDGPLFPCAGAEDCAKWKAYLGHEELPVEVDRRNKDGAAVAQRHSDRQKIENLKCWFPDYILAMQKSLIRSFLEKSEFNAASESEREILRLRLISRWKDLEKEKNCIFPRDSHAIGCMEEELASLERQKDTAAGESSSEGDSKQPRKKSKNAKKFTVFYEELEKAKPELASQHGKTALDKALEMAGQVDALSGLLLALKGKAGQYSKKELTEEADRKGNDVNRITYDKMIAEALNQGLLRKQCLAYSGGLNPFKETTFFWEKDNKTVPERVAFQKDERGGPRAVNKRRWPYFFKTIAYYLMQKGNAPFFEKQSYVMFNRADLSNWTQCKRDNICEDSYVNPDSDSERKQLFLPKVTIDNISKAGLNPEWEGAEYWSVIPFHEAPEGTDPQNTLPCFVEQDDGSLKVSRTIVHTDGGESAKRDSCPAEGAT